MKERDVYREIFVDTYNREPTDEELETFKKYLSLIGKQGMIEFCIQRNKSRRMKNEQ